MPATPNYIMSEIVEGQGQQAVTVNTALGIIDRGMGGLLSKSVAGSSNVTLTALEWQNKIFVFTGAITANIAVIVPVTTRVFSVYNAATGAFTLTVRTSAGSGVVVAAGTRVLLLCDGTDVYGVVQPGSTTGSFTITGTGFTTAVTGTALWVKNGLMVMLYIPVLSGTSNATTFTLTGIPAEIAVTQTSVTYLVRLQDNGVNLMGTFRPTGGTTVDLYPTIAGGDWVTSGTKAIVPCWIHYALL